MPGRLHFAALALAGVVLLAGCTWWPPTRGGLRRAADGVIERVVREPDYDYTAAQLKEAEAKAEADAAMRIRLAKAQVGKAAAIEYLGTAARWTFRASMAVFIGAGIGLVVGGFLGGVGRRGCLFAMAVAGGGIFVGYFITSHGYFVSEFASWCIIATIVVALPVVIFIVLRGQWDSHVGRARIAVKRADAGESARDAIGKLAVPQRVKSMLDDAWETARRATADPHLLNQAAVLLEKYRLPLPAASERGGR